MRLELLGPTRVVDGAGTERAVSAAKQRVVLAVLLLRRGAVVPQAELIDAVWGEEPPPNAAAALRTYVARLRRALGGVGERLSGGVSGYRMEVREAAEFDVAQAEELLTAARVEVESARWVEAAALLERAEALWRGPALADVPSEVLRRRDLPGLEELRVSVVEARVDADLRRGRAAEVVGRLRAFVADHPLREGGHERLVRALYETGRRDEALAAYRDARLLLRDELGIDPSAELQELHRCVLAGGERAAAPGPPVARDAAALVPAPRELPSDPVGFTGRSATLTELDAALREGDDRAAPTLIVLDGPGGVGKTAVAVHWAHRVADRFPGGQIHLDLQGFSATPPVDPAAALGRVLRSLGVPSGRVPAELADRTALLRTTTAGRRMVFLLDNARDVAQVRPLLPGSGCLVLVTSRNQLRGLVARDGARRVTVDPLDAGAARDLLARTTGRAVHAFDAEHVARLLDCCGGLPLALRIVAERLARDAAELPEVLADLAAVDRRLDVLASGDDELSDVRAVLSWSVRALDEAAARALRLLGTQPGPEFTLPAAAALLGMPDAAASRLLDHLAAAHLVEQAGSGRYRMHDLLRAYAREQTAAHPEDAAAFRRQLDWYLASARHAVNTIYPIPSAAKIPIPVSEVPPYELADAAAAWAWFDLVRPALTAAPEAAAVHGLDDHAWKLAWAQWDYLDHRGLHDDFVATHLVGLAAARRSGSAVGEGYMHNGLRNAYEELGRLDEATAHAEAVLRIAEERGDPLGAAAAHYGLGALASRRGDRETGVREHRRALDLYTTANDVHGRIAMLNNLASQLNRAGRPEEAIGYAEQGLALVGESGVTRGRTSLLSTLGSALGAVGEYERGLALLAESLELNRADGFPLAAAISLRSIGEVLLVKGDQADATRYLREALELFVEHGSVDADEVRAMLAGLDPPG